MPRQTTKQTCAGAVFAAYRDLSTQPMQWVRIAALRRKVEGRTWDADTVERTLLAMSTGRKRFAHLAPDENRKALTAEDRRYAIKVGGKDNHLVAMGG